MGSEDVYKRQYKLFLIERISHEDLTQTSSSFKKSFEFFIIYKKTFKMFLTILSVYYCYKLICLTDASEISCEFFCFCFQSKRTDLGNYRGGV